MPQIAKLRRMRVNDPALPAFCALLATPDVYAEFSGFQCPDITTVNRKFQELADQMRAQPRAPSAFYGAFADDGRLMAIVGFLADQGQSWLSYATASEDRGQGVAAAAVRLAVHAESRRFPLLRLAAYIDPANQASRRVLWKLGFMAQGVGVIYDGVEPRGVAIFSRRITPEDAAAPLAAWGHDAAPRPADYVDPDWQPWAAA